MRFALFTSLQPDFAASSWVQDASACDIDRQEQQLSWASATSSFQRWALAARPTLPEPGNVDTATSLSFPACPHKDLLCLAQHMQQRLAVPGTANNSSLAADDHVPIANAVSESLLQLAESFETQLRAAAAAAISLHHQQTPQHAHTTETRPVTTTEEPHSPNRAHDAPVISPQFQEATAASASLHAAHVDEQCAAPEVLAAGCEAATAHEEELKVMLFWLCHLTMTLHQYLLQPGPATAEAPTRSKKSGSSSQHHHQQQQQKWLQKTLPAILQQLCCCYRAVAGQLPSDTADCSLSLASGEKVAMFSRRKDTAAADKLLLATCFTILSTAAPGNSKASAKPAGSTRSNATSELPIPCLQLCAALFGSHVLFRHQQQMQQHSKQRQSPLVGELCKMLQDSQQHAPQYRNLLVLALTGLVTDVATMHQGMQVLCSIAEAVFAPSEETGQHQQLASSTRKKRQQPQHQEQSMLAGLEATASAAAGSPSSVLLLELTAAVLQQVATNSTDHCCQQVRLLAAAVLPTLLPAAVMHSSPHARKLWLTIASTAAATAVTAPKAGAVTDNAGSSPAGGAARQAAAAAAVHAHIAGVAVLTAAASGDRDANVRSRALSLLQEAVPTIWQQLIYWQQQQQEKQQHQQDSGGVKAADAAVGVDGSCLITSTLAHVHSSLSAIISTLEGQLLSSSKSCRIKALQLLQELLCNPVEVAAAVLQESATAADQKDAQNIIKHQQQQIAVRAYPSISVLLDAPQHSSLHCPASKVAAGLLLPQMAAVLQPREALQLVLSQSTSADCGSAAGKLLEGLSKCSARALYQVLQQQLLHLQDSATSSDTAVAGAGGTLRENALVTTMVQQQQQHRHRLQNLTRLQQILSSGCCCTEDLTRHAFLQVVQTHAAAVAATDLNVEEGLSAARCNHQQQQQQPSLYQLQQDLMLSAQLLELAGGCSFQTLNPKDLRAELAILTDTLDICCYWMQQIQAAAAVVTRETDDLAAAAAASDEQIQRQEQQQTLGISKFDELAVQYLVCEQLLRSIVRILSRTAAATGGAGGVSDPDRGATATSACTISTKLHRKLWGHTAASLMYHLDFVVSAVTPFPSPSPTATATVGLPASSQPPGSRCEQQLLLPALQLTETLAVYIQVLCVAHSSNRMTLHELLLTWHKDLLTWRGIHAELAHADVASSRSRPESDLDHVDDTAAAAAVAAKMQGKLTAFLLLLQHLAGFYKLEQQRFKQRLLATLQEPTGAAAAANSSQPGASEHPLQQNSTPQQQDRTTTSGTNLRKRRNTATADGDRSSAASTSPQTPEHTGIATGVGAKPAFDYMMGEESRERVEASTEEFVAGLMAETAPACYLPLLLQLLQSAESPEHVKVLALQALQPLLLCSHSLSSQHSTVIAALLADPSTPAALQLQAVVTAGELISAAPAQNQQLVQRLEQLLLNGLDHHTSSSEATVGMQAAAMRAAMRAAMQAVHAQPAEMQAIDIQAVTKQSSRSSSRSDVLSAAAGVYAVLLLHEKLLLAAASWSVVAAGLLALPELQAVSLTMQQLLQSLITQKRLPCTTAALGLLMNCPAPTSKSFVNPAVSTGVSSSSNTHLTTSHSAAEHRSSSTTRAEQLVEQHLLGFLSSRDLSSDELQLPLLSALGQAAVAGGWGSEGAAEPAAVLLVACNPTARGLDTLLNIVQANKSTVSQPGSIATLAHLQTYTSKSKTAAAAAGRARAAAAAQRNRDADDDADQEAATAAASDAAVGTGTAARAAVQAKLQTLLAEAAAAAATLACGRKAAAGKRKGTAANVAIRQQQKIKVARAAAAACDAAVGLTSPKIGSTARAAAGAAASFDLEEGTKHEQMLVRRLLADRQLALKQYRAKQHVTCWCYHGGS